MGSKPVKAPIVPPEGKDRVTAPATPGTGTKLRETPSAKRTDQAETKGPAVPTFNEVLGAVRETDWKKISGWHERFQPLLTRKTAEPIDLKKSVEKKVYQTVKRLDQMWADVPTFFKVAEPSKGILSRWRQEFELLKLITSTKRVVTESETARDVLEISFSPFHLVENIDEIQIEVIAFSLHQLEKDLWEMMLTSLVNGTQNLSKRNELTGGIEEFNSLLSRRDLKVTNPIEILIDKFKQSKPEKIATLHEALSAVIPAGKLKITRDEKIETVIGDISFNDLIDSIKLINLLLKTSPTFEKMEFSSTHAIRNKDQLISLTEMETAWHLIPEHYRNLPPQEIFYAWWREFIDIKEAVEFGDDRSSEIEGLSNRLWGEIIISINNQIAILLEFTSKRFPDINYLHDLVVLLEDPPENPTNLLEKAVVNLPKDKQLTIHRALKLYQKIHQKDKIWSMKDFSITDAAKSFRALYTFSLELEKVVRMREHAKSLGLMPVEIKEKRPEGIVADTFQLQLDILENAVKEGQKIGLFPEQKKEERDPLDTLPEGATKFRAISPVIKLPRKPKPFHMGEENWNWLHGFIHWWREKSPAERIRQASHEAVAARIIEENCRITSDHEILCPEGVKYGDGSRLTDGEIEHYAEEHKKDSDRIERRREKDRKLGKAILHLMDDPEEIRRRKIAEIQQALDKGETPEEDKKVSVSKTDAIEEALRTALTRKGEESSRIGSENPAAHANLMKEIVRELASARKQGLDVSWIVGLAESEGVIEASDIAYYINNTTDLLDKQSEKEEITIADIKGDDTEWIDRLARAAALDMADRLDEQLELTSLHATNFVKEVASKYKDRKEICDYDEDDISIEKKDRWITEFRAEVRAKQSERLHLSSVYLKEIRPDDKTYPSDLVDIPYALRKVETAEELFKQEKELKATLKNPYTSLPTIKTAIHALWMTGWGDPTEEGYASWFRDAVDAPMPLDVGEFLPAAHATAKATLSEKDLEMPDSLAGLYYMADRTDQNMVASSNLIESDMTDLKMAMFPASVAGAVVGIGLAGKAKQIAMPYIYRLFGIKAAEDYLYLQVALSRLPFAQRLTIGTIDLGLEGIGFTTGATFYTAGYTGLDPVGLAKSAAGSTIVFGGLRLLGRGWQIGLARDPLVGEYALMYNAELTPAVLRHVAGGFGHFGAIYELGHFGSMLVYLDKSPYFLAPIGLADPVTGEEENGLFSYLQHAAALAVIIAGARALPIGRRGSTSAKEWERIEEVRQTIERDMETIKTEGEKIAAAQRRIMIAWGKKAKIRDGEFSPKERLGELENLWSDAIRPRSDMLKALGEMSVPEIPARERDRLRRTGKFSPEMDRLLDKWGETYTAAGRAERTAKMLEAMAKIIDMGELGTDGYVRFQRDADELLVRSLTEAIHNFNIHFGDRVKIGIYNGNGGERTHITELRIRFETPEGKLFMGDKLFQAEPTFETPPSHERAVPRKTSDWSPPDIDVDGTTVKPGDFVPNGIAPEKDPDILRSIFRKRWRMHDPAMPAEKEE